MLLAGGAVGARLGIDRVLAARGDGNRACSSVAHPTRRGSTTRGVDRDDPWSGLPVRPLRRESRILDCLLNATRSTVAQRSPVSLRPSLYSFTVELLNP